MNCENNKNKINDVIASKEFYYKKLQDLFYEFHNYNISKKEIEKLIDNLNIKPFSFDEYLTNNSEYTDLILLMGKIIAMSDLNGYNKENWNLYDDKRVIAKAGVRQNDWVKNLLTYKFDNSTLNLTNSVKNAIEYIRNPKNNLTQLSINHKKLVAMNLLNISYEEENYFNQLKEYFKEELSKYTLANEENFGLLITLFLYCEDIKIIWDKNTEYWLVGSKWEDTDKTDDFIKEGVWINGFDDKYLTRVKSVNIGDKIAIKSSYVKSKNLPFNNEGKSVSIMKIKAIGEVIGNSKDGKQLEVSWDTEFQPKEIYSFSYRNTISKIDKEKWRKPIKWIFEYENQDDFFSFNDDNANNNGDTEVTNIKQTQPLNQILYGPPGTGKTYNTINKAIEIIENRIVSSDEKRKDLKERFEEYKKAGQIEFVTFHQSYGYEEFVEGIKAETTEQENIKYEVQPGIFKRLSEKASTKSSSNIDEKIEWLKLELVDDKSIDIKYNNSEFNVSYRGGKTFRIKPKNSKNETTDYPASIENIVKLYIGSKKSEIYNPTYTAGLLEYLYTKGLNKYDEIEDKNNKNYILIIDEINR